LLDRGEEVSAREEILGLIEDMGNMLKAACQEGMDDTDHLAKNPEHRAELDAMHLVGDLIQDWARGLINGVESECPYTHSHTREWCGYKECRES
jgi:hypothetical protein